jgi:hypothetical protein
MRTSSLAALIVAGALLIGCSKPEPYAGGAPSPNAAGGVRAGGRS